jgi:hypothetical protein
MTLVTTTEVKPYLRIEAGVTAYDTLIDGLIAQATAMVEAFVRRPIEAELRTFMVDADRYRHASRFFVPIYPIALVDSSGGTEAIVITDADGDDLIEDTDFRFNRLTGEVLALSDGNVGATFLGYPFTVEAWVGLSAHPDYDNRIEPVINAAITDIVADLYQRRSPAATNESTGGGVSTSYAGGMPERVKDMLRPFVMARAL